MQWRSRSDCIGIYSQLFLILFGLCLALSAEATNYNLSTGNYPPCNTSWSQSGSTYTCNGNGRVSLASGDTIVASAAATISANNGFSFSNNIIGSLSANINLVSNYGSIVSSGGSNTIYGSITSGSGDITLNNTSVTGSITTGGNVNLSGGSVAGKVTSSSNKVTTSGTDLLGGVTAHSSMDISGGTLTGDFVMTSYNPVVMSGVTMTSGSISGGSTVTISGGSTLGSSSSSVTISSNSGAITLNESTVYGTLTAPSYSTVYVNGGAVYGTCIPNSTPADACSAAATLIGSWRMDEAYWNGTLNEVKDSSGKNNHGRARIANGSTPTASTALVTPAFTSGSQSTCAYGQFDQTNSPIRTYTYVELSGFPALPTSFTFTAWIRSTNPSAQHQRILVRDDAQNGWGLSLADGTGQPRLRFFNRNIQNTGSVTGQGSNPSCGVFCLDTNSVITANQWHFIAATIDTGTKSVTLYVYSQTGTLLAKTSANYSGTWQDGTGTAAIGGESLASSEGTQSSWHFLGNIDEVKIYTGALTQTYIEGLRTQVRTCPVNNPDHYELQVPSTGIACMSSLVKVIACADNSSPCTNAFLGGAGTGVSLATAGASLAATNLLLGTNGEASTTLSYASASSNGSTANVTLSGEQLAGFNPRQCCRDGACSASNSCAITFSTAGLAFATTTSPNTSVLPNQVAGVTGATAILRAVKTNTTTGACEARVTGAQSTQLAYECLNPGSCATGQTLQLNSNAIAANNKNATISYQTRSLNFDASGTAAIPINFTDVGQIRLYAKLTLAASGAEPAYTLSGVSNSFVVKPYSLAVSSVTGNPGTTSTGAGFTAAGNKFTAIVEARNANNQITPSFGKEDVPESGNLSLELSSLVYPAGGNLGSLTQSAPFAVTATDGQFSNSSLAWSEVGSIKLLARLSDSDYLGAGDTSVLTPSANVGRFYPDHFSLTSDSLSAACSSFNYMGQNFTLGYQLEAQNSLGVRTTNYHAESYSSTATTSFTAKEGSLAGDLGSRVIAPAATWVNGVYSLPATSPNASFSRQSSTQPDGPFNSLQLAVQVNDSLDSRKLNGLNMNAVTSGNCSGSACTAKTLGLPQIMRFGRLRLDDAFGPESVNLPVNFATEYWAGSFYTKSTSDSCTQLLRSAISYPAGSILTPANLNVPLAGGATKGVYRSLSATLVSFSAGDAGHYFQAPGSGTGSFNVNLDLSAYPWLRFDWNQNGDYNDDTSLPSARFSFGQYRGNDRVIYWREKLQ